MGKKATFVLDEKLLAEAKDLVERKKFKSLNSFVGQALKEGIEKIRKEEIEKAILEASRDPLFLSDIKDVENDFEFTDFEY